MQEGGMCWRATLGIRNPASLASIQRVATGIYTLTPQQLVPASVPMLFSSRGFFIKLMRVKAR